MKLIAVLFIILIVVLGALAYYDMGVRRGCGINPFKLAFGHIPEKWCSCGYAGFTCYSCEEICGDDEE